MSMFEKLRLLPSGGRTRLCVLRLTEPPKYVLVNGSVRLLMRIVEIGQQLLPQRGECGHREFEWAGVAWLLNRDPLNTDSIK